MAKEELESLSEWMVELARKTPWEKLDWSSDQSPDLQESLAKLRNIKGQIELRKMQMGWGNQSPEKAEVVERKKLPSLLDPTVPGFSGYGTELDMFLKKRRVDREFNEESKKAIELKNLGVDLDSEVSDEDWLAGKGGELGLISNLIDAQQEQLKAGHLLDPTAPGYSGFGTEEDMELARRLKKHQMGLLQQSIPRVRSYNPDRVDIERSKFSPVHGLSLEI
jgi:hypothetical protein